MRPSNVVRILSSMFVVLPALLLPPAPAAASSQLNEYDGALCPLLGLSTAAGFRSVFDGTGNMIQPNGNRGSVAFLCPATLSYSISSTPYAIKNLLFTIDLRTFPVETAVTPTCQQVVDTLGKAKSIDNVVGQTDSTLYTPVTRLYYVCTAPGLSDPTQQYYLHSYQVSVAYQL
jgi:hypothetical protein